MEYLRKCEICDKEFTAKRSDVKCCSSACRMKLMRSVTDNSKSVTDKLSVTDIGYGPDDCTRKQLEQLLKEGQSFIPNWYKLGFDSKNHCKERMGWNRLMETSNAKL